MKSLLIKILSKVFFWMSIILMIISFVCIINVQIEIRHFRFDPFNSESILNYFSHYDPYISIFGAFLAISSIFLVIGRLGQQVDANKLVIRKEWIANLKISMDPIKDEAPRMYNYILKIASYDIFEILYKNSMQVSSTKQVDKIFKSYIKPQIADFEKSSLRYEKMSGVYSLRVVSYSYNSFGTFLLDLMKPTVSFHNEIENYFKGLYETEVEVIKKTF